MTIYIEDKKGFKWEIKSYDMGFQPYEEMTKVEKYIYDMETKYPGIATIPMPTVEEFKKILEEVKYNGKTKNKRNKR